MLVPVAVGVLVPVAVDVGVLVAVAARSACCDVGVGSGACAAAWQVAPATWTLSAPARIDRP